MYKEIKDRTFTTWAFELHDDVHIKAPAHVIEWINNNRKDHAD